MISANGGLPAHRYTPQVTPRWPRGSEPASLHAVIFIIIICLIGARCIWVFFGDLRWCRGQGKRTVVELR